MSKTPAEPNSTVASVNGEPSENYRVFPGIQPGQKNCGEHDEETIKLTITKLAIEYGCKCYGKHRLSAQNGNLCKQFHRDELVNPLYVQAEKSLF
jgi:hypothetical protein